MNHLRFSLVILFIASAACQPANWTEPTNSPALSQEAEAPFASPAPPLTKAPASPTIVPDSGWQLLREGLERRRLQLTAEDGLNSEQLYLLRIDPAYYRFDVGYHPGEPLSLEQWQAETGALLIINGGFFTETYEATGLIVSNGQASGFSYQDFGGMLVISETGPELRWLPQRPYNPADPMLSGLQSFPMLVRPGGVVGFPEEDGLQARRTVIGQDRLGRIIVLLAGTGTLTLHQLSRFLVESDLDLDSALNLDGGTSAGLLLSDPLEVVTSFSLLPIVITVYAKS